MRLIPVLLVLSISVGSQADTVLVAVAANFADTNEALAARFHEESGHIAQSTPGSTGKLFAQIKNGAPFQVFLSADAEHAEKLEAEGAAVKGTRFTYAVGKLALYSAAYANVKDAAILKSPDLTHLAVANPDTAPYGSAAVATLKALHLWDSVKDRIVYGENVAQAYQFAQTGATEAAFVAWSQVVHVPEAHTWLVPQDLYPPLRQDVVLLAPGKEVAAAKAYLDFLKGDEARKIIESGGYTVEPTLLK